MRVCERERVGGVREGGGGAGRMGLKHLDAATQLIRL